MVVEGWDWYGEKHEAGKGIVDREKIHVKTQVRKTTFISVPRSKTDMILELLTYLSVDNLDFVTP